MITKKSNDNSIIINYQNTDNVLNDVCSIVESAKTYAYKSVNIALVQRNWFIGYRIYEEELKEDYGMEILKKLSKELKEDYGKGFEIRNLYCYLKF